MLKIKNGNIFITKGQSANIGFKIWNDDGTPFVLPFGTGEASLHAYATYSFSNGKHTYEFYNPIKGGTFNFDGDSNTEYEAYDPNLVSGVITGDHFDYNGIITKIVSDKKLTSIGFDIYPHFKIRADSDTASVLVFSVYAGSSESVVLQKILNANSYITNNGITDYTPGGWNKFTKSAVIETNNYGEIYNILENAANAGDIVLVKCGDKYYHLVNGKDGMRIGIYNFALSIPLDSSDTSELESRNYTYDVAVYKGVISEELFKFDKLNFEKGYWKKQLVEQHTFTIGDSQNA